MLFRSQHGLTPVLTRGNIRTSRTYGRVEIPGTLSTLDFLARWIGIESLHLSAASVGPHVQHLEATIASLRKQNSQLAQMVEKANSTGLSKKQRLPVAAGEGGSRILEFPRRRVNGT